MELKTPPKDDLRERFILFLASKPADEQYRWADQYNCACGSFIKQQKLLEANAVWYRWNEIAFTEPTTYGALLQRVRNEDQA